MINKETGIVSPQISVIMSVYNGQLFLKEAVESILAQSFTDFEFIIIDDGSTDKSPSILRSYADMDERIRLVRHPNRGLTKALNEGLQMARGEFIARMDGDDIALPQRFEKQINYLRDSPDCAAVSGNVMFIDSEGATLCISTQEIEHNCIEKELFDGRGLALVHPAAMFRREAMIKVGGYQERYNKCEDLDIYLRLAEIGLLANLPDIILKFRRQANSVTALADEATGNMRKAEIIRNAMQRRDMNPESFQFPQFRQPRSVGEHHVMLAYMAINGGYIRTACKHALKAMRFEPFSKETLKVVFLSICLIVPGMKIAYRRYKTTRQLISDGNE